MTSSHFTSKKSPAVPVNRENKSKKPFLSVILLLIVLLGNGCILGPTVNYVAVQCGNEPCAICETNEWPCGNISRLTTDLIGDTVNAPDDYVLPPALDRSLNVFCLVLAYPVSLVSDVIT
ncbi:MAG: hypothetical protein J5746_11135, partial [Victivallales bacterium]|nr:hypothetical protein [Victivallales bacterium]